MLCNKLSIPHPNFQLSQFDRFVIVILLGIIILVGLLFWRGDQIGVQVVTFDPPDGTSEVSTRAVLRVTFDQAIAATDANLFTFTPPVSGTVKWEEATLSFTPSRPLMPETSYTVQFVGTLSSQQGRRLQGTPTWQFRTRPLRVLYIAPDEQKKNQLFVSTLAGGKQTQLTQVSNGIRDYTLSPDGTTIAYTALRPDGGGDLWKVVADGSGRQELLACPGALCSGSAWSPDGQRFVYERRNKLTPTASPGPPHLWWLDLSSRETTPVFEDKRWVGYGPRWSPDSQRLAYVAPISQEVQIVNVTDGRISRLSSRMGEVGVWSPQGDTLLVTNFQTQSESFAVHVFRTDLKNGQLTDLSGVDAAVEDSLPAWSPDGAWIAFTRKAAGAATGKQIWLMRPDGSEAHSLTNEPEINHESLTWSQDSSYLLYHRYSLKELGAQPGVWLLDVGTGKAREVIKSGWLPSWLP